MYTIYTYFNSEQVVGVINAIVMLVGGASPDAEYVTLLRIAAMIGLFMAVTYGFCKARGEEAGMYLIMVAIFYATLFTPRVTVTVEDHGPGAGAPVAIDNVPLGLAFFASTTSQIGHYLTQRTETFFSLPDTTLAISQGGLMGGPRALRLAQSASMPDPILAQDMINFMRDCINPELVTSPATVIALMQSTNIWLDISSAGPLNLVNPGRMVVLAGNAVATDCASAYSMIDTRLAPAATTEFQRIARMIFPGAAPATANTLLGSMLPAAEGLIMTASATTAQGIRQRMMINMLQDTSSNMAQITNDPTAAQTALAHSMAASSANVAYSVMAKLAQETLPLVRNAIELVVLGVFPIVLVLVIIAGTRGGTVLRSYVLTMLWVQMWAPLYAIVNYVGTMASAKSLRASLAGTDGVSIANAAQLLNTTISTEAVTGLLTIAVPMIALAIVKGGEVAMTSVTGSLTGPADRAAAKTGEAVGSGNVSMGNTSWGNHSAYNVSGNKTNTSVGISTGNWGQVEDGWGINTFRDGAKGTPFASVTSPKYGSSGVDAAVKSNIEASRGAASGRDATTARESATGLNSGVAASFTQSDASAASAALSQALNTQIGGSQRFAAGDFTSSAIGAGTTEATKLATSNIAAMGLGGEIGGTANVANRFANPLKGSGKGSQVADGAIPQSTVSTLEKAPDSAAYGANGKYGFQAKTTEVVGNSAETGSSTDQRQQISKNFDQVRDGAFAILGTNATTGQKAALNTMLGQVAEKLDSIYQTNTKSSLTDKASEDNSRRTSVGVGVSTNKESASQLAMHEAAREMGVPQSGIARAMVTNQDGFQDRVAQITGSILSGQYVPQGTAVSGIDGQNIQPPKSVGQERSDGLQAVNAERVQNDAQARSAGEGYRDNARRDAEQKGVPAANAGVDITPAAQMYADSAEKSATGQAQIQDAAPVNGGVTRAARFAFNDNSGMLRLASTSLLGGMGEIARSPAQLEQGFRQLADSDPQARAILSDIGTTGRPVTQDDIKNLTARADAVREQNRPKQDPATSWTLAGP